MTKYFCRVFLKGLYIQQKITIDSNLVIEPLEAGYTCYDQITFVKKYIEETTDEPVNIDIDKMAEDYSKSLPVSVIKYWNIEAENLPSAKNQVKDKAIDLINYIIWKQDQYSEIFAITATASGEGTIVEIGPPIPVSRKHFITIDVQKYAKHSLRKMSTDNKLKLWIGLYKEAVSDVNPDFKLVKLWSLLETMSSEYKGGKELKVRRLIKKFEMHIDATKYDGHDIIRIAYKHRNAIVHEGTANPSLVSKENKKWVSISSKNLQPLVSELKNMINFMIHRYIVTS